VFVFIDDFGVMAELKLLLVLRGNSEEVSSFLVFFKSSEIF